MVNLFSAINHNTHLNLVSRLCFKAAEFCSFFSCIVNWHKSLHCTLSHRISTFHIQTSLIVPEVNSSFQELETDQMGIYTGFMIDFEMQYILLSYYFIMH